MSQICSKMVIFLFSAYFGGHFCYHSNRKSRSNTRLLHMGYCSYKLIKSNFYFLTSYGGQNSLLMHVPLSNSFLFLFFNKMLDFRAGILKMLVRIINREDPGQTAYEEAV